MRITKRQLRRIIREEKSRLYNEASNWKPLTRAHADELGDSARKGPEAMQAWESLMKHLSTAGKMASEIEFGGVEEGWQGTEANDLAGLLEGIWTAAGFDPSEIFK